MRGPALLSRQGGEDGAGVGLCCEGVVHIYPSPEGDVVALRGVDLEVDPCELVAVLGPSGSGKSTLLGLVAGLFRASAGRVRVGGADLARLGPRQLLRLRATQVGLVLQGAGRNLLPYADAVGNIRFAQRGRARGSSRAHVGRPGELLDRLGLNAVSHQAVGTLSGGERQRVALAVGAATGVGLLLVDEPTGNLDRAARDQVVELLHRLNADLGITILVVTHDPAVAAAVPRTVTIRDGRIGSEGRRGREYAVVGQDGSIQLPPDLRSAFPAGSLVRVRRQGDRVELVREEGERP